jgi:hypothetical protein
MEGSERRPSPHERDAGFAGGALESPSLAAGELVLVMLDF